MTETLSAVDRDLETALGPSWRALRVLQTEQQFDAAVRALEALWESPPGSEGAERMDLLATLIQLYQSRHHPIDNAVNPALRQIVIALSRSLNIPATGLGSVAYIVGGILALAERRRKAEQMAERWQSQDPPPPELLHGDHPDADLASMSRSDLQRAALAMRRDIRAHRDADGHGLCWHWPELWRHLPDKRTPDPSVPPEGEFLDRCRAYRDSLRAQHERRPAPPLPMLGSPLVGLSPWLIPMDPPARPTMDSLEESTRRLLGLARPLPSAADLASAFRPEEPAAKAPVPATLAIRLAEYIGKRWRLPR